MAGDASEHSQGCTGANLAGQQLHQQSDKVILPPPYESAVNIHYVKYESSEINQAGAQVVVVTPEYNYGKWTIRCYKSLYFMIMTFSLYIIVGFFVRIFGLQFKYPTEIS